VLEVLASLPSADSTAHDGLLQMLQGDNSLNGLHRARTGAEGPVLLFVTPASFGKANQRVGQTFGSGGPRAFQLAARLSF
jgi:hypothetical protein